MPITLADFKDEQLKERGIDPRLRENFIAIPTAEELKPNPYEIQMLEELVDWQKNSAKSRIVLGVPLYQQKENLAPYY